MTAIPFYIDLKSPYSFVAAHRGLALARAGSAAVAKHPLGLVSHVGRVYSYLVRVTRRAIGPLQTHAIWQHGETWCPVRGVGLGVSCQASIPFTSPSPWPPSPLSPHYFGHE